MPGPGRRTRRRGHKNGAGPDVSPMRPRDDASGRNEDAPPQQGVHRSHGTTYYDRPADAGSYASTAKGPVFLYAPPGDPPDDGLFYESPKSVIAEAAEFAALLSHLGSAHLGAAAAPGAARGDGKDPSPTDRSKMTPEDLARLLNERARRSAAAPRLSALDAARRAAASSTTPPRTPPRAHGEATPPPSTATKDRFATTFQTPGGIDFKFSTKTANLPSTPLGGVPWQPLGDAPPYPAPAYAASPYAASSAGSPGRDEPLAVPPRSSTRTPPPSSSKAGRHGRAVSPLRSPRYRLQPGAYDCLFPPPLPIVLDDLSFDFAHQDLTHDDAGPACSGDDESLGAAAFGAAFGATRRAADAPPGRADARRAANDAADDARCAANDAADSDDVCVWAAGEDCDWTPRSPGRRIVKTTKFGRDVVFAFAHNALLRAEAPAAVETPRSSLDETFKYFDFGGGLNASLERVL
ncbi:hypothetical protein M885DRAFT_530622 [Pelagophyceae sp. CCMP2097]|nr:hypothetical protein M885DRAFT_530622 [Pelagophyceae sp. CCMP2097]